MSTGDVMVCRSCGARYGHDRFACAACDVGLVPESAAPKVLTYAGEGIALDLDDRTFKQRTELVDLLERDDVPHRWEHHDLVVAASHEELVRTLVGASAGALDEGEEEVGYDLDDWLPEQQAELVALLAAEDIPNRWDATEIVVPERHADRVEEIIDDIDHPDAIPAEADDGDGGGELLGSLFVAADVLARDPGDPAGVGDLLEIADRIDTAAVPYGLDVAIWDAVRRMTGELADLLAEQADEGAVTASARGLRDALRDMV